MTKLMNDKFASKQFADLFIIEQTKNRTNVVPDYYVNYEHVGWKPVTSELAKKIEESGIAYIDNI